MAYITLKELKKILPEILDQWIDKDDESWEWIFQEIEQNCHVGKKKVKKTWKSYAEDYVSGFRSDIRDLNGWYIELNKKVDELKRYATENLSSRINSLSKDVEAAKSMAQTAKQRTEVDYSKYSGKSDGEKMCKTCKYFNGKPEMHTPPCDTCNNNNNWEVKENDIT